MKPEPKAEKKPAGEEQPQQQGPNLFTMAASIQAHQKMSTRRPGAFGKGLDDMRGKARKTPMGNEVPDEAGPSDGKTKADEREKEVKR